MFDAGFFEFFLAEGAIVLEAIRIGCAADHFFALLAQRLRLLALAERVVEDDDVGPVDVLLPILRFGHESVRDVAFLLVPDKVADLVALFGNLPGNVADESRERNKQKILLLHHTLPWDFAEAKVLILSAREPPKC